MENREIIILLPDLLLILQPVSVTCWMFLYIYKINKYPYYLSEVNLINYTLGFLFAFLLSPATIVLVIIEALIEELRGGYD